MVGRYSLWAKLPTKRSCVWWNSDITLFTIAKLLGWWWKILFWDISSLANFHRKKSPHEVLNKFPPQKNIRSELGYRKLWEGQWVRDQLCVNDPVFTCLIINKASFSSHKLKPPTVLRAPWTVSFDHCIVMVLKTLLVFSIVVVLIYMFTDGVWGFLFAPILASICYFSF